ncbi:yippee-like protein, partial [Peziza echinospora]
TYLKGSTSVLKCRKCQSDICFSEHIVSKGFNGRHGRAYLVHALPTFTHTLGKPSTRQLATGAHIVADISCSICLVTLGWKYISASDPEQQYKVGKFILE